MIKTRAFAWIATAGALGAALLFAQPAAAQYYGQRDGYVQRIEPYGAPPRGYHVPPPVRGYVRPVDPYYGNAPHVRKYGRGPARIWRRWVGRPHPAWRDHNRMENAWRPPNDGWGRPRYYDYR